MNDQLILFAVILGALLLFVSGRLRHDVVALLALLAVALGGLVPPERVFSGFGHSAVITVAAVLVISAALFNSGLIDVLGRGLSWLGTGAWLQLVALTLLVTVCSAFMNNVGALAILMPVAIQLARRSGYPPSRVLMPLAFASLLGGLMTAIGTPANLIVATFRADAIGTPFTMFDFTPVGAGVAAVCLLFIWVIGWRLIPVREGQGTREELFEIKDYLTELEVPEDCKFIGRPVHELERVKDAEVTVVTLIRDERAQAGAYADLRAGDVVVVEADAESLKALLHASGLELRAERKLAERFLVSEQVTVAEAIVAEGSLLIGRTAGGLDLRRRYGVNLLAVSRQGRRPRERLHQIAFRAGDVLLLQGDEKTLGDALKHLDCLPLAERNLRIGSPRRTLSATAILAVAITLAALGIVPIAVAFTAAAVAMLLAGMLSPRELYTSVDWPIIVLLGAMIPVGVALETSGAAQSIADLLLGQGGWVSPFVALLLLLVLTMTLSDVINNAAAAVLLAPVALSLAAGLGVSPDPYLMAVAVGASAAFLTPIGHQSNTLVMGPGGYRFGDYWRLGLPLSALYAAAALVLIPMVWSFRPM